MAVAPSGALAWREADQRVVRPDMPEPLSQLMDRPNPSARRVLFEHLVAGRECGDCAACCTEMRIREPGWRKAAGSACPHCTGDGCGIYARRPPSCRSWFCLWRRMTHLPDALRPDRCGVLFAIGWNLHPSDPFERIYVIVKALRDPSDLDNPAVLRAIGVLAHSGSLPIWLEHDGRKSLIYPGPIWSRRSCIRARSPRARSSPS